MNSSAFFTLRCVIYLISLQLFFIVLSSFSGSTIYYRGCNYHEIMPVLTRSKAKLLHASINEDENNNISANISINEIPRLIYESQLLDNASVALNNESLGLSLSSSIQHSTNCSLIKVDQSSLSWDILDSGQGDTPPHFSRFQNLKISNYHPLVLEHCHNFSNGDFFKMASDCDDNIAALKHAPDIPNITQLFASLSAQITHQTSSIQDKLSTDFSQVIQAQDKFKQEVCTELDELRSMITQQQLQHTSVTNQASSATIPSSQPPPVSLSSAHSVISPHMESPLVAPVTSLGLAPGIDVQTHMLQLLTDSFSKLSSVLVDKSTDTKSDWPKFSGDSKKF
jgi:hypothetical protein